MFIKVDLPAPFSPRSACTSPRRMSRSTSSLATIPGNSFRMPRIWRMRLSSTERDPNAKGRKGGHGGPPFPNDVRRRLERRGHLDLAGDDLRLVAVHERDPRL